jgi:hypothetical protein
VRSVSVNGIPLRVTFKAGPRDPYRDLRQVGEKIGVPFPLKEGAPWPADAVDDWIRAVGWAFVGACVARRGGRPRGSVTLLPTSNTAAQNQRDKRTRRRTREDKVKEKYLAYFLEKYAGS